MNPRSLLAQRLTCALVTGLVCNAAGATSVTPRRPATFTVDVAGSGYSDGAAVLEFSDGNACAVTLTVADGAIESIEYVSGYVGSDASGTVVQDGGSAGEASVATYVAFAEEPAVIDFGECIQEHDWRYTIAGKTVTEHDTAPGSSKTVTVHLFWTDEPVTMASAATLLAGRKVAGSAKTLTNAIDTTQYLSMVTEFRPAARFCILGVDWTALDSGSSFTLDVRINRV